MTIGQKDQPANTGRGRVILITGASSGIGQACANHLGLNGFRVYGTSRRGANEASDAVEMIQMDVDDETSVHMGVDHILAREGRLDVVVNNAGYSLAGSVEDTSVAEAQAQFETNFFGAIRVCRAVVPIMRRQQTGHIVNVSSLGGQVSIPFQGLYCASKFALEGFTEALRMEVKSYGIRVVLIEPGDFHTNFTANRLRAAGARPSSPYFERFTRAVETMASDEMAGPSPEPIALLLEQIVDSRNPRLRYAIGSLQQRLAFSIRKFLPHSLFEWLLMKYYGLC